MHNLIEEGLAVDRAAFAGTPEDLIHAVIFPTGPIIGEVPHKDSELRNFGGERQPGFTVAKLSSSCHNLSHIAVRIVKACDFSVLIDWDERIAPIVVFDDPIQENGDEHVVAHRGLAAVETGFKIVADKVPCLIKDFAVKVAERVRVLSHQGRNCRVVVEEDHPRSPGQDGWKWR